MSSGSTCGLSVNLLSTVNVRCHLYSKEGGGLGAYTFSFEKQHATGIGGLKLIAGGCQNKRLSCRCD